MDKTHHNLAEELAAFLAARTSSASSRIASAAAAEARTSAPYIAKLRLAPAAVPEFSFTNTNQCFRRCLVFDSEDDLAIPESVGEWLREGLLAVPHFLMRVALRHPALGTMDSSDTSSAILLIFGGGTQLLLVFGDDTPVPTRDKLYKIPRIGVNLTYAPLGEECDEDGELLNEHQLVTKGFIPGSDPAFVHIDFILKQQQQQQQQGSTTTFTTFTTTASDTFHIVTSTSNDNNVMVSPSQSNTRIVRLVVDEQNPLYILLMDDLLTMGQQQQHQQFTTKLLNSTQQQESKEEEEEKATTGDSQPPAKRGKIVPLTANPIQVTTKDTTPKKKKAPPLNSTKKPTTKNKDDADDSTDISDTPKQIKPATVSQTTTPIVKKVSGDKARKGTKDATAKVKQNEKNISATITPTTAKLSATAQVRWEYMTVAELKEQCRIRHLSEKGKKQELLDRLQTYANNTGDQTTTSKGDDEKPDNSNSKTSKKSESTKATAATTKTTTKSQEKDSVNRKNGSSDKTDHEIAGKITPKKRESVSTADAESDNAAVDEPKKKKSIAKTIAKDDSQTQEKSFERMTLAELGEVLRRRGCRLGRTREDRLNLLKDPNYEIPTRIRKRKSEEPSTDNKKDDAE